MTSPAPTLEWTKLFPFSQLWNGMTCSVGYLFFERGEKDQDWWFSWRDNDRSKYFRDATLGFSKVNWRLEPQFSKTSKIWSTKLSSVFLEYTIRKLSTYRKLFFTGRVLRRWSNLDKKYHSKQELHTTQCRSLTFVYRGRYSIQWTWNSNKISKTPGRILWIPHYHFGKIVLRYSQ